LRCIEKKKALVFAEYLERYLENNIVINEYAAAEIAPPLFQHLTQLQLEAGQAEEALTTAEKGISACSRYGKLHPLPHLVQAKGKALSALGRAAEAQKALSDAKAIFAAIARASSTSPRTDRP
jgi:tetratricopeptide (TPR) repeat protein